MPQFKFLLTRDVTESVEVTIDAPTLEDAHDIGIERARNGQIGGWQVDDNFAETPYVADEAEFKKIDA